MQWYIAHIIRYIPHQQLRCDNDASSNSNIFNLFFCASTHLTFNFSNSTTRHKRRIHVNHKHLISMLDLPPTFTSIH